MNVIDRLPTRRSSKALKSLAAGATLLTLGVGGAAAQPDQAVAAANLVSPVVEHAQPGLIGSGGILDGIANIIEAVTPDSY